MTEIPARRERRLTISTKAWLALRVVRTLVSVRRDLARYPLADLVARSLAANPPSAARGTAYSYPPAQLGRAVNRVLGVGGSSVRCIHRALVLQRLLAEQGVHSELVIGLREKATDQKAHAWVELSGRDIGPSPGRNGHVPLARYPGAR